MAYEVTSTCVLCLQRIMRLGSGAWSTVNEEINYGVHSSLIPARGGVSCPTITGEVEGHRPSFTATT